MKQTLLSKRRLFFCKGDGMNGKNAFQYIPDDPVVLELTGCGALGEVHERIKRTFGFPDYYGENWNAMWDFPNNKMSSSATRLNRSFSLCVRTPEVHAILSNLISADTTRSRFRKSRGAYFLIKIRCCTEMGNREGNEGRYMRER